MSHNPPQPMTAFRPARRARRNPSVTDDAIDKIQKLIISGSWGPGDRLPKESELAAQLGLSRNSLREAVRALSQLRVLEVRQGDGTYVTSLEPELLLESTSFVSHLLVGESALELFELRRLRAVASRAGCPGRGRPIAGACRGGRWRSPPPLAGPSLSRCGSSPACSPLIRLSIRKPTANPAC